MTRLIFVHGTGVRKESFEESFGLLSSRLKPLRDFEIVPCFWGEELGSTYGVLNSTQPTASSTDSSANVECDSEVRAWAILDADPWSMVKAALLTSDGAERDTREPVMLTRSFEEGLIAAATKDNDFTHELWQTPLRDVARQALETMLSDPLFEQFTSSTSIEAGSKIIALAETYLAISFAEWDTRHGLPLGMTGDRRQRFERLLVEELGGEVRSLGGKIAKMTSRLLWPLIAPTVERHRDELTQYGAPLAGDVLKYFARPDNFREHLLDLVDESQDSTTIIAHSLGAIIAFDTLSLNPRQHVQHLITVGTQVGLLYQLDALPSLNRGDTLPPEFPKWDNILDRRDFLAYGGSLLFPGRTSDHLIDNRAPFPRCHESYFDNDHFYEILDRVLAS